MKIIGTLFRVLLSFMLLLPYNALAQESEEIEAKSYDYIIVGVGSSGSILARKLSDRGASVLALDLGEFRYNDPIILSPNTGAVVDGTPIITTLTYDPRYAKTYPLPLFPVNPNPLAALLYSEGSGSIGGGGAHNYLAAVRGTPSIYDEWATVTGDPRWFYNNILPKMRAVETYTPNGTIPSPTQRGFTGPISVTQLSPLTLPFYTNLALDSNSTPTSDYNNPDLGVTVVGTPQAFITPGANSHRSYSALEFLPMRGPDAVIDRNGNGLNGRNLKVLSNARVLKINFCDRRACSVEFAYTNKKNKMGTACLKDKGRLILTAGAVQTPNLLLHSGVGPAEELLPLGIRPVVDSPNVGRNLQDHYGVSALVAGDGGTTGGFAFIDGNGPSVEPPALLPRGIRRIQVIVQPGAPVFGALGFILNPQSRGSVKIVSSNALIDPKLDFNMYDPATGQNDPNVPGTDANLAVRFLRILRDAVEDSGYTMLQPNPLAGDYASNDTLFAYATDISNWGVTSHVAGTARMGTSIANSVVDGRLKVHGLENVYIGDASVQPRIPDGNTNFSAYYIALELANILGFPTPPAL